MQLYVVFFGLPSIGIMVDAFLAAVIVFSINEGAYNAETIRGALESVPQGQMEAANLPKNRNFRVLDQCYNDCNDHGKSERNDRQRYRYSDAFEQ